MAFTVEDGTLVAGANSLVDEDFADEYFEDSGVEAWADSTGNKEAALIRGTRYVLGKYYGQWGGSLVELDQALDWPRTLAYTRDGRLIPDDEIPLALKQAICEAALRELLSPSSLVPDQVSTQTIKRQKKKLGPLETEIEYADAKGETIAPDVPIIDQLLASLLYSTTGTTRSGFLMRA